MQTSMTPQSAVLRRFGGARGALRPQAPDLTLKIQPAHRSHNLVPLPPGSSTLLGIPLILAGAQLAVGRSSLWLPQVVGNRTLFRREIERLVCFTLGALRRTEQLL